MLYEGYPMAFVIEAAGGKAIDGLQRILDVDCKEIHGRSGIILGSADDVEEVHELYKAWKKDK